MEPVTYPHSRIEDKGFVRLLQLLHPLSHLAESRVPALDLIIPAGETYCSQAWDKDLTLPQRLTSL